MTRYPRFKEWRTKLWEISGELNKRNLELVETLTLENKNIEMTLINGAVRVEMPGEWEHSLMVLRPYYTLSKPEFNDLLFLIKERAGQMIENFDSYAEALASEELPRTVVAKMKGSSEDTSSISMLRNLCLRKGKEIQEVATEVQRNAFWQRGKPMLVSLTITFPIEDSDYAARLTVNPVEEFFYGAPTGYIRLSRHSENCTLGPDEAIKFLGTFPVLKKQADEFQRLFTEAFKNWKKSE